MVARHGRLDRTPLSPRDRPVPAVAGRPRAEQARPGERETAGRDELEQLTAGLLVDPCARTRWMHRASLEMALDWLEGFPGESWQQRWLLSGSDAAGWEWVPPGLTGPQRLRFTKGAGILIVLRAVRPAYEWLFASRLLGVYDQYRLHNQAATFSRLTEQASHRGGSPEHEAEALNALTRMSPVRTCSASTSMMSWTMPGHAGPPAALRRHCRSPTTC